jgi:hypothetical protein
MTKEGGGRRETESKRDGRWRAGGRKRKTEGEVEDGDEGREAEDGKRRRRVRGGKWETEDKTRKGKTEGKKPKT